MNDIERNEDHISADPLVGSASAARPNRRWLRATAAAAIVAGGVVGGMALGQPGSSSAQESGTTDSTTTDTARPDGHRFGRIHLGGLDAAAEALGMTTDELHTALRDGQTLAEIAADKGVDVDTLITKMVEAAVESIDAAVDAGDLDEARATEIKADLTERITALVNGEAPIGGPGGRGPGGPGGPGFGHRGGMHLDTAAEVLGLEVDDLAQRLRDGETLADVAEAEGVDVDTLIDALVDDARERITDMVNGVQPERPDTSSESGSSDAETSALTA